MCGGGGFLESINPIQWIDDAAQAVGDAIGYAEEGVNWVAEPILDIGGDIVSSVGDLTGIREIGNVGREMDRMGESGFVFWWPRWSSSL
jgi:hypothetical protein